MGTDGGIDCRDGGPHAGKAFSRREPGDRIYFCHCPSITFRQSSILGQVREKIAETNFRRAAIAPSGFSCQLVPAVHGREGSGRVQGTRGINAGPKTFGETASNRRGLTWHRLDPCPLCQQSRSFLLEFRWLGAPLMIRVSNVARHRAAATHTNAASRGDSRKRRRSTRNTL